MQRRNVNKLDVYRKKQEEMDERLRAAGIYEEDLTEKMKAELLQCLEASCESARMEEEMQKNIQWEEQTVLTNTLHVSSIHQKDSDDRSSSSSSKRQEEEVAVAVKAKLLRASSFQHPANQPSTSCHLAKCLAESQKEYEDEDLFLLTKEQLDVPDHQAAKSSTKDAPSTSTKAHHPFRRLFQESTDEFVSCLRSPMPVSPILGRGRKITAAATTTSTTTTTTTTAATTSTTTTATTTITSIATTSTTTNTATSTESTQGDGDDSGDNSSIVPATLQSPQISSRRRRPLSPEVVLVPLPLPCSSPPKNGLPFSRLTAKSRMNVTPSGRGATLVTKGGASVHRDQTISSREDTGTPTPPMDSGSPVQSKGSGTPDLPKDSATRSIIKHLSASLEKGSRDTKNSVSSCRDSGFTKNASASCSSKNTGPQSLTKKIGTPFPPKSTVVKSSGVKPLTRDSGTPSHTRNTGTSIAMDSDTSPHIDMGSPAVIKRSFHPLTRDCGTPSHKGTTCVAVNSDTSTAFKGFSTLSISSDIGTHALVKSQDTPSQSLMKDHGSPCPNRKVLVDHQQEPPLRRASLLHPSSGVSATTITATSIMSEEEEVSVAGSHQPASPLSDPEEKVTLRTATLRPINVFSRRSAASDVPLQRRQPLPSEHSSRAFHRGPKETPKQCRQRIVALMDNASQRLQQHQASLLPLPWQPPLTVHPRLKESLDRPQPASRSAAKQQHLEEEGRSEEREHRRTRQAARNSPAAPEPLPGPSRSRGLTVLRRLGQGRTRGLRGYTRPRTNPLPKVSSDSDTDLEIGPSWPSPPKGSSSPSPPRAEGTALAPKGQPQQSLGNSSARRTLVLNSDSEGSGADCHIEAAAKGRSRRVPLGRRDAPSSPTASPDLCIIEEEEEQQQQPLPPSGPNVLALRGARRVARRGRRRPTPDPMEEAPSKQRKTHTLHKEDSAVDSIPQQASYPLPESPDVPEIPEYIHESNAEEREERERKEEEILCPICQKTFKLEQIEVHASDCMGIEEESQQQQHDLSIHGPKRQKKMRGESVEFSSEKTRECSKQQMSNLCEEEFREPEDLHLHIQSCQKREQDDVIFPSYTLLRTYKRRGRRGHSRAPSREVASSKQESSQSDSLPDNNADEPPSPEF